MSDNTEKIKEILGKFPLTADAYWSLMGQFKPWSAHFKMDGIRDVLPQAVKEVKELGQTNPSPKKICVFASLHYWIEQATLVSLALAGQGHQISLGYLPYAEWDKEINAFDLRKQDLYAQKVLSPAKEVMSVESLLESTPGKKFLANYPAALNAAVDQVSDYDTQYTLQIEKADHQHPLYQLRKARNSAAAIAIYEWFRREKPDLVVAPNGTILEMGIAYQVAQLLGIPTVTFEFADQRERIWLAQNGEIMSHDTDAMWQALGSQPLPEAARKAMIELFSARKNARLWGNFARQWQKSAAQGAPAIMQELSLDERPVALMATNVLGDSLTLGRQRISETMADWILGTIRHFMEHDEAQLIIRIHPGELLTHGTSMVDVIAQNFPELPAHIHLIRPEDPANTYDLIDVADVGLVYTTTVGLEMAMSGLPVITAGSTHYAGKGITLDPENWESYQALLQQVMADPAAYRLTPQAIEQAWLYGYLFFFEFSLPFPWHLLWLAEDFNTRPMRVVLSPEGQARYAQTFAYLSGEPLDWYERGLSRLNELSAQQEDHAG